MKRGGTSQQHVPAACKVPVCPHLHLQRQRDHVVAVVLAFHPHLCDWHGGTGVSHPHTYTHAQNNIEPPSGLTINFLELNFWDKNTMACAVAMPFRRDLPATTRILSFQAKKCMMIYNNNKKAYNIILSVDTHSSSPTFVAGRCSSITERMVCPTCVRT